MLATVPPTIRAGSAWTVRIVDPENETRDVTDPLRLLTAANGATSSFRMFESFTDSAGDPDDCEATSSSPAAANSITINRARRFKVGDLAEITLDDATLQFVTVNTVGLGSGTLGLAEVLAAGVSRGARVRRAIGGVVAMTEHGTPDGASEEWGFEGDGDPALPIGLKIRVEISFVGDTAGDALKARRSICTEIVDRCEA
jgi:hypothetical protein